ncbi:hypothetical protein P4U99_18025 [Brevibacillus agri]|uniref:hypothetical protein n=3 Tax=Brevibacillus agri TaxID=51101 RepID=UPI001C8F140E|nr:hypothetical protein [Brevibacillus agri]MBY0053774.1 hypothetical protein [Brevibacillus agri]MCG5254301.1 hypothetical protein [Brevibacillus agri]MED1645063.1 hypothetical protein [Brevibacillus agri]MED1654055.1 hypothetical protein [Brevibacillus agri]MED1685605.1 hypothetical protein [Brevibacillus agri]
MYDARSDLLAHQRDYLLSCQLPGGAFLLGPGRDQINPYFTNLALIALVRLQEWEAVRAYMDWYVQHLNADGYINDFRLDRGQELDTGAADSEDSYHATFFSVVAEWTRSTGDCSWLAANQDVLAYLLQGIARLQQTDGLTWAKHSFRVKYLMDNCEVAKGLDDAHYLFASLGNALLAQEASVRAAACKAGIAGMYSRLRRSYAMYDRSHPGWRKWYPDVTSQAFPIVYSLCEPTVPSMLYERITKAFPRFDAFVTGDTYPWMVMGVCARMMGDEQRVRNMLTVATDLYIYGPRQPYWLIHEAGRFVELLLGE